ncbi:MAG: hypothetical protein ACREAZ_02260, partial [Nitrososphaera sp.]
MLVIEGRKTVNVTGMNEYELDTTEMPDGKYSIKLVAADHAGNENTAMGEIIVSNVAPQILIAALLGLAAGGGIASAAWLAITRRRRAPSNDWAGPINLK